MTVKAKATRGFVDGANRVRRNQPLELDQADYDRLKAIGLVEEEKDGDKTSGDDLEGRGVKDLLELAKASNIDLGDAKKEADIIAAIRAHRAQA